MDEKDKQLKRETLSSRLGHLSAAKQALLDKRMRGASAPRSQNTKAPIERAPRDEDPPLPFLLEGAVERVWADPEGGEDNLSRCFRLEGALDEAALHRTINELARRHEALRTNFQRIAGQTRQVIADSLNLRLPLRDLQHLDAGDRLQEGLRLLAAESQKPYDPSRDLLWRIVLVRLAEDDHLLLLTMSHLISDAWALDVLVKDSLTLYRAYAAGEESPLPELPIQFADYAYWQRRTLQGQTLAELVSYWQRQLDGLKLIPELRLPIERAVEPGSERTLLAQQLRVEAGLVESLYERSRREGVSLFMLLLAALLTVLHRYSGADDFGIPSPVAKRHRVETRGVIGWFADFIVLRVRLSGVETFSQLLERVREVVLAAYEHQDLPFAKFTGNGAAMWQEAETYPSVRFNMLMGAERQAEAAPPEGETARMGGLRVSTIKLPQEKSKSWSLPGMAMIVQGSEQGMDVVVNYEGERYEAGAIKELLENYRIVLGAVAESAEQRLDEFPLVLSYRQP